GIAVPGAWEIAIVLAGGVLATPAGPARVPALIEPADAAKPLVLAVRGFAGSAANYRSLMRGLTEGTAVSLVGADERRLRFVPPGGTRPAAHAHRILVAASDALAARGIYDPRPEEVRAALFGVLQEEQSR
ncbi:MAG TPA: hypothetical protein VM489_05005, partial [Burkholderiales bacterium]|nr:hypothetical protein [Burkholderiales bacterium]